MKLKVLKLTANNNLLLQGGNLPLEGRRVFFQEKKVGKIIEVIGSVKQPLHLAKPVEGGSAGKLVGKEVEVHA